MSDIETVFNTAVATARHALEQFNAQPMVASKRGGPRLCHRLVRRRRRVDGAVECDERPVLAITQRSPGRASLPRRQSWR
jgi:hypothetical protein